MHFPVQTIIGVLEIWELVVDTMDVVLKLPKVVSSLIVKGIGTEEPSLKLIKEVSMVP